MTSLKRFWRALDHPVGICGVTAELQRLLGSDLRAVAPLLRTLPAPSETYPCPTPGGEGCPRHVVRRDGGQAVAVCGCSPKECDPLRLTPEDVVVHEFDPKRLCRFLTEQLPVTGAASIVGPGGCIWSLGSVRTHAGAEQVFVLPGGGQDAVSRGVNHLLASFRSPWIALIPTQRSVPPVCRELVARGGSSFVALEDVVGAGEDNVLAVHSAAFSPDPAVVGFTEANVFRRAQDVWFINFGGRAINLRHMVGFEYIAEVLRQPGKEIEALALAGRMESDKPAVSSAGLDVADDNALRQVRTELKQRRIQLERVPAKDWPTKGRLQEEITQLEAYLTTAEGRHGQSRKVAGNSQRARTAVTNAIVRGIERIEKDSALATHLRDSLRTGTTLLYLPSKPVDWHF